MVLKNLKQKKKDFVVYTVLDLDVLSAEIILSSTSESNT